MPEKQPQARDRQGKRSKESEQSYTVDVEQLPDGRQKVINPSPMRHMRKKQRLHVLKGMLESAACQGNVDAVKALLSHERWEREMREGRPPARGSMDLDLGIKVINTIPLPAQQQAALPESVAKKDPAEDQDGEDDSAAVEVLASEADHDSPVN